MFAFIVDFSSSGSTELRLGSGNAAELDLEKKVRKKIEKKFYGARKKGVVLYIGDPSKGRGPKYQTLPLRTLGIRMENI